MSNLIQAIRMESPDTIPVSLGVLPAVWLKYGKDMQKLADQYPQFFGGVKMDLDHIIDNLPASYRQGVYIDEWGCEWHNEHAGNEAIVVGHPVKDEEDVFNLKIPTCRDGRLPHGFMYLRLLDLVGFENAMIWFAEEDETIETLIDKVLEYNIYQIAAILPRMDELVSRHDDIMTRFDPEKRVGLIVDEWGCWFDVEPGTNPGFLYQQNTMRDAMVAAITLNIFNRHCDRVIMANLAQTVNVLQSVLLTEGDKVVLTPTYHVFDLYKAHQDAREIDCFVECKAIGGDWEQAGITASASEKEGVITVTLANLSDDQPETVTLNGVAAKAACGRMLSGKMDQYNDFDASPLDIQPLDVALNGGAASVELPPCTVAEITLTC